MNCLSLCRELFSGTWYPRPGKAQKLRMFFFFTLMMCTSIVFSQQKTVTGTVTDSANAPVENATVAVKGTSIATQTNAEGRFTLAVPANRNTLVVSSVGYESFETTIGERTNLVISLRNVTSSMNEVVVVGYGTQRRRDLTGAVSSVNAETIEKVPVISATQALQGRASGVQITNNDGAPGGNISVLIRGIGSLAPGGNDPLFVIDGYPTTGGINSINPNDIATIDILKDASATAIYGIRAANGVVIITTKKGARGSVQISLDAYEAIQSRPRKYDLLNAQQFATLSNEVETTQTNYQGLPLWENPQSLTTVDWQDAIYRTGLTQNYSIGIRGGNDKMQSAASFGYYDQKGIVLGSFFKRFTAGLNLDFQPVKWLKSSTSIKYSYQDANTALGTQNPIVTPNTALGSSNGVALPGLGLSSAYQNVPTLDSGNRVTNLIKDGRGNYGFYNPIHPSVFKLSNPVYEIETNEYKNITNFVLANSSLEITILPGLRAKTNIGINLNNFSGSFFRPADNRANQQYPGAIVAKANYRQSMNTGFEWLWENTLAYDKTFGIHAFSFVGGVSAQKNTTNLMGASGEPPNSIIRDLAQLTNLQFDRFGNGRIISSLASQFARLTYQLNDKYILTGTVRRDGSSKFDTDNKYGVFPSGAVAWKVKNESFMESVAWVDDLKLRAGYGVVGNQTPIPLFQYQALYAGNFAASVNGGGADNLGYPFNGIYQNGIAQTQPANPNLEWETDYTTNIGVDAAFLRGALTMTVDWFKRTSKNFLLRIPSSPQTGYNLISRNVGEMENKGFEVAVNYRNSVGKDFQYGVGLTWTAVKNRLTDITSGVKNLTSANFGFGLTGQGWNEFSQSKIGGEVGEFYGYQSLGIFQTQGEIDKLNAAAPGGIYYRAATSPGDRYFADVSGENGVPDGKVDANDRVSLGSPQPDFFGGLNLDFAYKSWDFNLYFYGSYGNKILNYIESNLQSFQKRGSEGVENVSVEYYENRWTPNNPSNEFARALANDDNTLNSVPSSAWIEDGSFLKLKNLTLGYSLPSTLTQRLRMSRLRVYVSTQNLFTITKYSGIDPEIGIQGGNPIFNGVDNGIYPSSRFYTFGLNVTF